MRHELVQRGEVVSGGIDRAEVSLKRRLAQSDVETEDAFAIELREVVEVGVVLGDDRDEGELAIAFQIAVGIVDEKRIAPRDGRPTDFLKMDDIDAGEGLADVVRDG
jgi:hypothetical protein